MYKLGLLQKRHVAIARLKHTVNIGRTWHKVRFFIIVLTSSKMERTKNALETSRMNGQSSRHGFRQRLLEVRSGVKLKNIFLKHAQDWAAEQSNPSKWFDTIDSDLEFDE